MKEFKGIFTALLTPFDKNGNIDEKALEQLIERNIAQGVTGFYVAGSTSEVFLLTEEERRRLYRMVSEINHGRKTLIAHIGTVSTEQAAGYGKLAQRLGYDAISSVPPFYYKFSAEEIKNYYFDIVEQVDLPMLVYNIPAYSGVSLTAEQLGGFFRDERFLGVKHTSNDFFTLERTKRAFPEKIVYNGYDEMFLSGLAMGADGGIGSTYNFMADKFVKITELYRAGKMAEALELQNTVNDIIAALLKTGVGQGEKAVLSLLGIEFGQARAPFRPLSADDVAYLEKTVLPLL